MISILLQNFRVRLRIFPRMLPRVSLSLQYVVNTVPIIREHRQIIIPGMMFVHGKEVLTSIEVKLNNEYWRRDDQGNTVQYSVCVFLSQNASFRLSCREPLPTLRSPWINGQHPASPKVLIGSFPIPCIFLRFFKLVSLARSRAASPALCLLLRWMDLYAKIYYYIPYVFM